MAALSAASIGSQKRGGRGGVADLAENYVLKTIVIIVLDLNFRIFSFVSGEEIKRKNVKK
jgi:hypothetical protein